MATTLDAKLRITADTAQAGQALKQLGKDAATIPASVAPATKALDEVGKKTEENTKRVKDAAYRLSLLRPQITDIVSGLATGQSPFTVLLQQGGQLGDVFGGFGNALKALGTVFTPVRLLVGGLAAAIGTVAFQAFEGGQESDALRKSLALTGNAAGVTAGQVDGLARSLADAKKASIGNSREAVAEVVASGKFTGAAVESASRAVLALGKLNGQTAAENLKAFSSLADGVSAGAAKLNQQFNFLSVEQFKLVRELESQGRTQEAIDLVTRQYADTLEQRAIPALGLFERAWAHVKNEISGVADAIKGIGRDTTLEDKIKASQNRLANILVSGTQGGRRRSTLDAMAAAERARLSELTQQLELQDAAAADAGDRARKEQDAIRHETVGFQQSLNAIDKAGIDKRLAEQLAGLAARRSALERANTLDLISESEHLQRLTAIDLAGLEAQRAALLRQRQIEQGVRTGTEEEANAKQAALIGLETQLTQVIDRIAQARTEGERKLIKEQADGYDKAAKAYEAVWQKAFTRVAEFARAADAARAKLIDDPAKRSQTEADLATKPLRDELAALSQRLQFQIDLTIDPVELAKLESQLRDVQARFATAIAQADRDARFKALSDIATERQGRLAADEQAIRLRVQQSQITEAEGERQILALRREQGPALERILTLIEAIAVTPEEKQTVANLRNTVTAIADLRTELEKTAHSQGISSLSTALTDIETGAKTGKAALLDMVGSYAKAMLDVLNRRLAEQLLNQFSSAAGASGFFASVGNFFARLFHQGGVVGAGGPTRAVNPLAFVLAPRYHGGGIAGLMPDEVPAVLRKGEEVLRADDPRHRRNGGTGGVNSTVNVSVTALAGDQADARQFGDGLGRAVEAVVSTYVINQMRPGGILARR